MSVLLTSCNWFALCLFGFAAFRLAMTDFRAEVIFRGRDLDAKPIVLAFLGVTIAGLLNGVLA